MLRARPELMKSAGQRRLQFLCDSLSGLRDELDGRLLVTRGAPEKRITNIAKEIDASAVYASEDFTPYGRRRDDKVRTALGDVPLHTTGSPYLVSPGRVTKDDGSPYKVFTAFFNRWRDVGWRAPADSSARSATWVDPADVRGGTDIPDPGADLDLKAGEQAALKQWARFRRRRARRLRRRPQPTRQGRHQQDVGASEVRHDPPADNGRGSERAPQEPWRVPARAGLPRLLCRRRVPLARQHVVELEPQLRRDRRRRPGRPPRSPSRRGKQARQAFRSSTPACVSCGKPVSCTTASG